MNFTSQMGNALFRTLNRLPNLGRRRSTLDIVNGEYGVERESLVDILVKSRIDLLELLERQTLQFASAFDAELHRFANGFVGQARGHTTFDEVRGGCPRIHESGLCGLLHAGEIEVH